MRNTLLSILMFVIAACQSLHDQQLEFALEFAGSNRTELEKVLNHYNDEPEKLEAARFLIRNMPHWYSYKGWQLDSIAGILADIRHNHPVSGEVKKKWRGYSYRVLPKVYDAHVITAGYLIENIDLAFEVRDKYPWNKNLPFEDFCELILPYRLADEPLSSWRKLYYHDYGALLDSVYRGSDVIKACRVVNSKLKKMYYTYNTDFQIPHMNGVFLYHNRIGYCREVCDLTLYAMRACGIPVATDYFVYSPEYQHYHDWPVLRDTTGKYIQFGFNEFEASRDTFRTDGRKKGKVYRYCFGMQPLKFKNIMESTNVPSMFKNRFVRDVTDNYFDMNQVTVPLQVRKEKYIYLGVFSPGGWIPVDMALAADDGVTFHNLEPHLIYQTLYMGDDQKLCPAGYPFLYEGEDRFLLLSPDVDTMEPAVLKRKMSLVATIREWAYGAIIGSKIEGAGNPAFRNAVILYQFTDTLSTNYCVLTPETEKEVRYVRYVAPEGKYMEVAELSVYGDTLCEKALPLTRINQIEPVASLDKITDNNVLTYFRSRDNSCYVGYDLGSKVLIKKIVFSPRNDDNYVWPGDRYELFYQDGMDGWKSLGIKTAFQHAIEYSVPHNALLWLRNLTKGKEEQLFIYKNGKQYFNVDFH